MYDVIIIGAGAAGLGAGLYAARYKLNTMIIGEVVGGTGLEAHKVDNWLGEPSLSGAELMDKFISHVKGSYKVPIIEERVKKVEKKGKGFLISTEKEKYECKALILATGMKHRKLEVPGEKELAGKGVSYCYTCDATFFKDKIVGVVGGSDSAALGALMLSNYAKKVIVLYRGEALRAEPISVEQVLKKKNIEVMYNVNVKEIKGKGKVESVILDNKKELKLDGVFIEVGHVPSSLFANALDVALDAHEFIIVGKEQDTTIKGVFAAGDITNATGLKQFITSASQGSIAAMGAYNYLRKNESKN